MEAAHLRHPMAAPFTSTEWYQSTTNQLLLSVPDEGLASGVGSESRDTGRSPGDGSEAGQARRHRIIASTRGIGQTLDRLLDHERERRDRVPRLFGVSTRVPGRRGWAR